jgi:cholesterol oxidase
VGTGWGTNGNSMFLRYLVSEDIGRTQGNPPVIGIHDLNNPITPILVECAPLPIDLQTLIPFPIPGVNLTTSTLMYLACGLETARGRFVYNAATQSVDIDWPSNGNDTVAQAAKHFADRMNNANGGSSNVSLLNLATLNLPSYSTNFTYHPLGGMVLGEACDFYGRVKGYDNLYVVDGALMPGTSACANPSLTIAAIAERCMEEIVKQDLG